MVGLKKFKIMSAYVVVAVAVWMVLEPTLAASDLTFDIEGATADTYKQLLTDVRNKVKDENIVYGGRTDLPVMAAPSPTRGYLLVDFTASEGRTITIAVKLSNDFCLYVIAYLDKLNGNFRSHIFNDLPPDVQRTLFLKETGAANRLIMNYGSSYAEVEKWAGIHRAKLGLGKEPLTLYFNKVYGMMPVDNKNEAKFMLIVMQMLSEATRFSYIQREIEKKFHEAGHNCYKPDSKAIEFEKSWRKITLGIKNSKKDVISPPLDLLDPQGNPWKVSSVEVIAKDMGLLKYEGATTTDNNRVSLALVINKLQRHYNQFISFFKANNGDDDYEAEL